VDPVNKFAAVVKTGALSSLEPSSQSGAAPGSAPATGAAVYAQNAPIAQVGAEVKQIVEDALKAASTAAA
jgi:hypothetical protein